MKKTNNFAVAVLMVALMLPFAAADGSIVDTAVAVNTVGPYAGSFDTLIAAVQLSPAIANALDRRELTVFAPTDDAFEEIGLNENNIDEVPRRNLANILLYHVTRGELDAEDVLDKDSIRMLNRKYVEQDEGILTDISGNKINIIVTDVEADNGYIHVIDGVLSPVDTRPNLLELAVSVNTDGPYAGSFDTLIAAVQDRPEITRALMNSKSLTVFAPTDKAFAELGLDENSIVDVPPRDLTNILKYHVTVGTLKAEDVLDKDKLRMLNGGYVDQDGGVLTDIAHKERNIIVTDVQASNGVIHVIDGVLIPTNSDPNLLELAVSVNSEGPYAGSFDTLIAAVQENPDIAKLLEKSSGLTVFAPTDEAFAELGLDETNIDDVPNSDLTNILRYHITVGKLNAENVLVRDRMRMLNRAYVQQDGGVLTDVAGNNINIIVTDVKARNGYIHVIDGVLSPVDSRPNLVEFAVSVNSEGPYAGSFDTLIAALGETPGIAKSLEAASALTVFAPTDDAFGKLGLDETNIDDVPRRDLVNILLYHVTKGKLSAEDVLDENKLRMLNRRFLEQDSGVLTDRAGNEINIIITDVAARNGYIHAIDGVLSPR